MKQCPKCKEQNPDSFKICEKCGEMLIVKSDGKSTSLKTEGAFPKRKYEYQPSIPIIAGDAFATIYLILSIIGGIIMFIFLSKDKYGDFEFSLTVLLISLGVIGSGIIICIFIKLFIVVAQCQEQIRDFEYDRYINK